MAVAYLVLAHRLPEQLARLVGRLQHPDDVVWVHVDAKTDAAPFVRAVNALSPTGRVEFAHRPVACRWGGDGIVRATVDGMMHVLQVGTDVTHVVLLSGQDYPLKSREDIRRFFAAHGGETFMYASGKKEMRPDETLLATNAAWWWNGDEGHLRRRHYWLGGRWRAVPNRLTPFVPLRPLPRGLLPYQGSAFWAMDVVTARHVVDTLRARPDVLSFFRRSYIPDENIFHMLVMNSSRAASVVQDDLHHIRWQPSHRTHPEVLRVSDAPALLESPKLFARKFDAEVDVEVLDILDGAVAAR